MRLLPLLFALAGPALAQDLVPKGAPQAGPIVITGATLHTISEGVIAGGSLVFDDGRITAIYREPVGVPASLQVVDGAGLHVYPGFFALATTLGLGEVGSVDMSLDHNEAGAFTPEVFAAVAVNPDSWMIPVTRRNGVLTAGVFPTGGRVPGRASVLSLDGWTFEDMALVPDAGLVVGWPSVTPDEDDDSAEEIAQLTAFFDAGRAYFAARAADPALRRDARWEGLSSVLGGERPLLVQAQTLLQIESAVAWSVAQGLRVVLVGGRDAGLCTDLLVRHSIPVAVQSTHRMPHRRDLSYASTFELPGVLEAAGVRWCLTQAPAPWSTSNTRNLPYEAAACVAFGLAPEAALRAVTLAPAEMLGVGDQLGSLEVGKRATFFLADGDPFELTTRIRAAYIDGREVRLSDKQTALDAKYREKYRQLGLLK